QGIQVDVKCQSTSNAVMSLQLMKTGVAIGATRFASYPASNAFVTLGGTNDLWGTTWTSNDVNASNFGVQIPSLLNFTSNTDDQQIDFIRITIYGIGGPGISLVAGSQTTTIGWQYVFCYGNSNSGHISSPSPVSASTGAFTSKNVQVTLTASTDA